MAGLQVVIVTPEKTALDMKCEAVSLPLIDGEIGILQGHAPTLGRLGYGEMRVRDGGKTSLFYVDGGFAQIADDTVTVLTGRALTIADMNIDDVRQRLSEAESNTSATGSEAAIRRQTISQAKAQLRMLEKA